VVVGDLEVPLASLTVPSSEDCTPLPAFAVVAPLVSSVSGQAWVQPFAWVQVIFPPFSEVSMYRVWPCPLTRTVPTPRTLFALIVAETADEAPAGALLPGEPAAVFEDDEPHAATVAGRAQRQPACQQPVPQRTTAVPSLVLAHCAVHIHFACAFPQRSGSGLPSYFSSPRPQRGHRSDAGFHPIALRYDRRRWYRLSGLYRGTAFWVRR